MDKKQQMIEYMVQDIVEMLTESQGIEFDSAMLTIYESEVYMDCCKMSLTSAI